MWVKVPLIVVVGLDRGCSSLTTGVLGLGGLVLVEGGRESVGGGCWRVAVLDVELWKGQRDAVEMRYQNEGYGGSAFAPSGFSKVN